MPKAKNAAAVVGIDLLRRLDAALEELRRIREDLVDAFDPEPSLDSDPEPSLDDVPFGESDEGA